jgi:hypothetical protein
VTTTKATTTKATTVTTVTVTATRPRPQRQLSSYDTAARLLVAGAGLLLVVGGCSDNNSPQVGGAASSATNVSIAATGAPSSSANVPVTVAATTLAPGATPAPVDGAAVLQQALAGTAAGYHFNQTATVDGVVALTVDGDRLTDGARVAVSNDSGLVFYVITPDGTWLMPQNGEWEVDDSDPPAVDPIDALRAPSAVTVAGNDGTTVQLAVTVPLSSLGIPGDGDAALQVAVVGGALSTITYSTSTSDGKAVATTTIIGPVVDSSPVVAPI